MALRRWIAGLIWAAALLAAAQLLPSAAYAHAGHQHHSASTPISAPAKQHAGKVVDKTSLQISLTASSAPAHDGSAPAGGCIGGCCGLGIGCCGAVLPGSAEGLTEIDIPAGRVAETFERSDGIDPDTLVRPPKSLA